MARAGGGAGAVTARAQSAAARWAERLQAAAFDTRFTENLVNVTTAQARDLAALLHEMDARILRLRPYARHDAQCAMMVSHFAAHCSCGLLDVLKEFDK